jgi:ubiquinone/menaquinone biosynthesis C-methylase UbiE
LPTGENLPAYEDGIYTPAQTRTRETEIPMIIASYKQLWDSKAGSQADALIAVDGSSDESIVQSNGKFTAGQVSSALDIQTVDRVLELGCGVARIGRELAPICAHWTGVDISGNMIERASERTAHLDNVSLYRLDHSSLEMIPDDSIDKAYSIAVMCHMDKEDLYLYLEELQRVVKPGGMIFVETWNLAHPVGWKRWEYEVRHWSRSDQSVRKDVSRNQFCTPDEFELYQRQAGFEVIRSFSNSPWVQSIATASKEVDWLEKQARRIEKNKTEIAYSVLFGEMFEKTIAVIYGVIHPREAIAFCDEHGDTAETDLFRPFILGLWRGNPEQWGEAEKSA